jgi:PDZ domain-containing protein
MPRRAVTFVLSLLLLGALAVAGALADVPYVAESPGPTFNTLGSYQGTPLIQVKGHPVYRHDGGHLNLVTVSISGGPGHALGLFTAISDWLDPHTAVVPENEIFSPGTTQRQTEREAQLEMQQSQDAAVSAALAQLGIKPTAIRIAGFVDGAPSAKTLKVGDVIASVEDTKVTDLAQLTRLISGNRKPGDTITLGIRRGGKLMRVTVPLMAAPGEPSRAIVGIYPQPVWPFTVDFHLEDVGGPSAGMMFALGIIDLLTKGPLTGGTFVAGTGEISADGQVGAIGGIAQKMVGASRDGARYFLAPAANCADVRKADVPQGLDVVKVATLHDALGAVRRIARGDAVGLPHC